MTDEEKDWQTNHGNFIEAFLLFLNKQTDQFVLKGGTALSLCYGLDRFSEDIDLDGRKQDIKEIVKRLREPRCKFSSCKRYCDSEALHH